MAQRKGAAAAVAAAKSEKPEEVLQAVIIVESFDDYFQPISLKKPRCLLPLCNVPILEYTLEFLANSGVQEAFLFCKSHPQQIKDYVADYKQRKGVNSLTISTLEARNSLSVGDVLRDLYRMNLVQSNFILCSANVVSNMNIKKVLEQHIARQAKDPNQIITLVLMESSHNHRIEDRSEEACYFLHPHTRQILYHHSAPRFGSDKKFSVPLEVFESTPEIETRSDLVDTHIAVCSKSVPQFFEDNFDYQSIRGDFVKGIIHSDIYTETIYAHILRSGQDNAGNYGAGVTGTAAYDAISRDIISRWAYPICLDSNLLFDTNYRYDLGAVYKDSGVVLARQSRVERQVVLGKNTIVESGAWVRDSVCGSNCVIKAGARIFGSYIFSDVIMGKNSKIKNSIVGFRARILDNVVIERGCMIGDDVVIGPNVRIPPFTKIGATRKKTQATIEGFGDDVLLQPHSEGDIGSRQQQTLQVASVDDYDVELIGVNGKGYNWGTTTRTAAPGSPSGTVGGGVNGNDDDDEEEWADQYELANKRLHYMAVTLKDIGIDLDEASKDDPPSDYEDVIDSESEGTRDVNSIPLQDLEISGGGGVSGASGSGDDKAATTVVVKQGYQVEVIETLNRAHDENHDLSTALLEFNALRMVYDASPEAQRRMLSRWLLLRVNWEDLGKSTLALIKRWKGLFEPVNDTDEAQIDMLWALESSCAEEVAREGGRPTSLVRKAFQLLVRYFFELDLVDESAIIEWYSQAGAKSEGMTEIDSVLVKSIEGLVSYLEESSEEEDDEDESGDEDEDNDESE